MARLAVAVAIAAAFCLGARAQEPPLLVTYDDHLEEPRNLEVSLFATSGRGNGLPAFVAPYIELEYGATHWWTTEVYLESQHTSNDSTIFTGWRWEHRVRPFRRVYWVNPVLYAEFENINEASRIEKEIVGLADTSAESNAELRQIHARELETKLILSSHPGRWTVSENFIVEKNLSSTERPEFGYSIGVGRALPVLKAAGHCRWCATHFSAGVELYGGLGTSDHFGLHGTAQYISPAISWRAGENGALRLAPAFNLHHDGPAFLFRVGYSYEIVGFGNWVRSAFSINR